MANESTKWLYEQLTNKGYNVGKDIDEFDNLMRTNADSRKWAYETATNEGFNVGKDINEFTSLVAPQPVNPVADAVTKVSELARPSAASGNGDANVSGASAAQTAPAEAVPVDEGQQPWTQSVQDRVRASYQMQTVADGLSRRVDEGAAKVARINEPLTAEGRQHRKQKEMEARMAGAPATLLGLTGPAKAKADEEKSPASTENAEVRPDAMSPVPYGVEYVDGNAVTKWLMPDGSVTTNMAEADAAEYVAKQQRLHDIYRKNTKDISFNIPKGKSVRVGVEMSYGRPVVVWRLPDGSFKKSYATADDEKFISDFQQRIGNFDQGLAVSKFNETSNAIGKNYAKYAAEAWADAEDKYEKKVSAANSAAYSGYGGRENRIVAAGSARHGEMVAHLESFDLEKMMDNAWDRIGEQGQRELIADCLQLLEQNNPAGDRNEMQKAAVEMARNISDNNVYNYALERNTPKSKLEFFVRKIADVNPMIALSMGMARKSTSTQGDMAAYNQAMSEYGEAHKFLDAAGFVSGLIFDPVNLISMGAGSVAGKTVTALATKTSGGLGTRLLANSWKGRALASAASGAGYMASFEGLGDMRQQFVDGGWTDSNGEFHEGFSMAHALKKGGAGALLGTGMGLWGSGVGNVFTKATKATDNVIGKVGIRAAQVPVSVIGEGTIFAMPEIIEFHTMEDDAFDKLYAEKFGYADETDVYKRNKARDAARNSLAWDAWNKSQATIFAIKVSGKAIHGLSHPRETIGHVTKTLSELRGKDAREHRSFSERVSQMMDRSPFDIVLTKEEREELRRAGYGELSELFRKDSNKGSTRADVSLAEGAIEQYTERVEAEEIGDRRPEFDGYSAMEQLMHDGRVSESARAKAYFILTGRMLPMSTVTGYVKTQTEDGKITVNSVNARGEVVTSRIFSSEAKAQIEVDKITRQAELNAVDMGERYAEAQAQMRVAETTFEEVGAKHKLIPEGVRNIYEKYSNGEKLSEAEQAIVNDVNELAAERMSEGDALRPEWFRERIKNSTGIDVDAALRKNAGSRTEQEAEAVSDYVDLLYKEAARDRKAREMWGDEYRQMREEEKAERRRQYKSMLDGKLLEGSEPEPQERMPIGRAVMKYQDRPVDVLSGRVEMTDDGTMIDCERSEKTIVIRDIATGKVEMVAPEAILSYEEYLQDSHEVESMTPDATLESTGISPANATSGNSEIQSQSAVRYERDDTFSVIIPGKSEAVHAAVFDREGDNITIWSPVLVNESSDKCRTMPGYLTDLTSADLDAILQRDAEGNPVGYVSANPPQEAETQTNLSHIPVDENGQPKHDEAVSDAAPDAIAEQAQGDEATVTADTEEYDRGFETGLKNAEGLTDEKLNAEIKKLHAKTDALTIAERGALDAYIHVQEWRDFDREWRDFDWEQREVERRRVLVDEGKFALSRIPVDEQGEPMLTHESVNAYTAWDGAVEFFGSDADAQSYVDAQVKNVTAAITAAEKAVDKVKPTGGMKKYKDDLAKARAAVDSAKGVLARWQAISQVSKGRKAEAEAEAAAQRAYEESITRGKEELKQAYDEVRDVPEAVEILRNMEPQSIDEVAALLLSGSKVLWNDEGVKRGVKSMLGYGEGERKGLFGLFATSKNGGETLERLAEDKMEELCNVHGIEYDNYDALTALTDVLGACRTRGDLYKYIQNRRIGQALQMKDDFVRHMEEEAERMSQEAYHMSVADREAYESQLLDEIKKIDMKDADVVEMNAIFADEIIERQRYEENIRNEQGRADSVLPAGSDVLRGEQADYGGGIPEASAGERRIGGDGGVDRQNGAAPESTPDREQGNVIDEAYQRNVTRYDRTVTATPEAQRSAISRIIDFAKNVRNRVERAVIGGITKRQAKDFADNGIDVDETWVHSFESSAVVHNQGRHGDSRTEKRAGQIAITSEDYARIPEILEAYDRVTKSPNRSRSTGNEVIIYEKDFDDGYIYYLEEKRDKRKSLSFQTMYKKKKGTDSSDGLMPVASPSTPTAPPDNLSSNSDGKGINFASDKQTDVAESSFDESNRTNKPDKTNEANGAAYETIVERGAYSVELRHGKDGDMFAVRLKKGARLSEWKDAVKDYGTWSGDGRGEILFDSYEAMTKFLKARGEEISEITDKAKWVERDMEATELLYAETGLREGQIWTGPDGTSVKIGARGFVKGPDGWNFAATVTYPDGRKEMTLTPARRISDFFKKNEFEQNEPQLSVGRDATRNRDVYEAAKGMLESAGIDVVEVSDDDATELFWEKNTPVDSQPNRANEKLTSGSVLLSISGNSSSNRAASKEAEAKLQKKTLSAKNKITKFRNGDYSIDTETLDKAMSGIGKMFAMDTKGGTRYAVLKAENGDTIALRLGDHAANGNNFARDNADKNVSIVIERKRYDMPESEIEFTEATIAEVTFNERPREVVNAIVDGVDGLLRGEEFTLDESIGRVEKKGGNNMRFHIRTYHGTGADFDKFDLQYVGSGEGAQAFGWGGYVTEVKGIGKWYATGIGGKELLPKIEKVSGNIRQVRRWLRSNENYDKYVREGNKHLKELQREYKAAHKIGDEKDMRFYQGLIELQEHQLKPESHAALIADKHRQIEEYQKELDELNGQLRQKRHLYTVRIPDDTGDNYLDWDKKISDQIRDKVSLQAVVEGVSLDFYGDKIAAAGYFSKMGDDVVGYQLYRSLVRALGSDKNASEFLSRAGLAGIRYAADHNNGGRLDGKKNYVVFNDSDMKISGHIQFMKTPSGTVYGWTVDGKVYLNRDAMNPETPLHEYTHLWDEMVRRENPELWERGKELLKQTPEWNEVMDDPNYADIRNDEDAVASEVHSRLTGQRGAKRIEEMMKEAAAEPDIVEKAKKFSLVHQLKRWLSDMFKGLKRTLSKWSNQDLRDLTTEDFADLTLRDLAEGVNPGQVSGDTRFQIMGERGIQRLDAAEEVSTRLDNLAVAREMEKDKVDAHTIRVATGWERGADGLWRYEIPDFEIDPTGQARKNSLWVNLPWGKEFDRLTDKVLDGAELTREESIQFDELSERAEEMRKTYEESEIRYLDDYVIDESLFTAYPGLRQIRIEMYSDPESGIGSTYYEKENLLRLNERLFDIGDLRSILVHEVQHAIQAEEGFARGGSVRNIRDMALNRIATNGYFLREFTPSQLYDLRLLRQKAEEKIKNGKYKRLSNAIKQVLKEARKYSSYVWLDRHDNNENSYMTVYDALNRYTADELYAAAQLDGHQLYNRVSGEVEARNAEKRMTMSDDERRQTLLRDTEDISREDQIFLMNRQNRRVSDKWLISEGRSKYQADVSEPMMSIIERLSKKYRSAPIKEISTIEEIKTEELSKKAKDLIVEAFNEDGTQAVYCSENKKIYIFAGKYHDNGLDYIVAHESVHATVDKFGLRDSEELSYWHKRVIGLFSDELPNDVDEILREGILAADFEDEFGAYTIPWISGNKRRLSKVLTSGDSRLINLFKTISEDVYGKEESERRYSLAIQDKEGADIHARPGKGFRGLGGENRGRGNSGGENVSNLHTSPSDEISAEIHGRPGAGGERSQRRYNLALQAEHRSTFQNRSGGQLRVRGDAAERGNNTTGSPDSEFGGNLRGGNPGNREIADTHEPRKRYGRGRKPLMAGKSLFDWADSEAQARREVKDTDEHAAAAIEADAAIDEYAEAYDGYLKEMRQAESDTEETGADEALRAVLEEQAAEVEAEVAERRERLEDSLRQYYLRENTLEDATRIARDMVNRVEAEVEIRQNGAAILRDILYGVGRADRNTVGAAEIAAHDKAIVTDALDIADATVRTGGGRISYNALGHLPDAAAGEFSYIERQFSRSGEFSFTGNGQIRSRGDVAYLFRALEDYSVEHVFAAFVNDGHVKVLHIGMGGPTSSSADMGAIRAGYDAFGADTIYLVHNHPSGMMKSSAPDRGLMLQLENAFGDEVPVEGIIIDTTSGRYVTFDSERDINIEQRSDAGGNVNAEVMRFDKADRSRLPEKPEVIRNSSDVAQFVSAQRLGAGGKVSYLILSNGNEIIGNFHTEHGELTADGLAEEMVSVATKFGGRNVIVYGNTDLKDARRLGKEVERLSLNGVRLLDAMEITNGLSRSANDEGMLYEPGSGYSASQEGDIRFREVERINAHQQETAQTSPGAKGAHVEKLANKLNTPIRIINDINELRSDNAEQQERMRRSKAFYVSETGEITVVLPNNANVEDIAETVLHEVVAHKGLREMIGEENYDAFCDEVYKHLKGILKRQIDKETTRSFMREPEKGYEYHRRVAVDELFGRLSEKGFEDFTEPERGIWKKLKAKVLEAINEFLGSLKLPKWVKLGDNELRYILWRSHERLRNKDYVDMARDIAKREELGLRRNEAVRERKSAEEVTADRIERLFDEAVAGDLKGKPVEVGRLTEAGREYLERLSGLKMKDEVSFVLNPSDLVHMYRDHFGINEKDKGNNIPLTTEDIRAIANVVSNPERIIFGVEPNGLKRNLFYFLAPASEGAYNLLEIYGDRKGNLTAKTFYKTRKGVSQRALSLIKSEHLTSVTDGATLSDGAKLPKFFDNPTIAEEESFEYRFRDGETGDIWKDRSVGLEERITNAAIRLSNNHSGDLTLRNDAQKAVIDNLQSLLHEMRNRWGTARSFVGADRKVQARVVDAMNAQAMFDRATVKRVSDLARILLQNGYLSDMTSGEIQRLLSAVKNSTAMHDISDSVQKIMDIMVNNQLRNAEGALRQLLSIRGSKVDARGVEVQGTLDVDGQRTMEVVKDAMVLPEDKIISHIEDALNRMSDPNKAIADRAAIEYAGLNMALDYVQNIADSKAEEKTLRDSLKTAKEDRDAGRMTDDAYKQFVETTEDAIRKNKIERAEAYFNLVGRLSDSLRGSIENAKAFREAEKARVSEIHHNANSDMEGRPANEHHKDDWKDKMINSDIAQFLLAPLGTFDQILRVFGNKSANGEGYLWNRFMRGWVDCRNKELLGVKEKYARLDEKAAELFGKGETWGSLIRMESKMPKATVSFWDGGEMRDHELTQGNLLYVYMVDKMTDGRMKLRRMGITESDIAKIENFLDPRFKALGDWLQDEFLVDTRDEYNETHKRMFGASMAAIEDYFPLKILKNARVDKEEDVNQQNRPDGITTKTGSIIKRRTNNLALDVTGADVLSMVFDHIIQMEHWSAYAEWNRDLNTLRTYKRFRNQVVNMTTVYGGGEKLWKNFNDLCLVAAGEYQPPVAKLDKAAVNFAKGVSAAKVNFRIFTALKQLLSAPAYAPEVSTRAILKSIAHPYEDFEWCLENMPIFRERWHSRISGDPRLLQSDMDWKAWRNRVMEISSRLGMTPNAFVDAVTVSIGARAMYETRLKQYVKEGYPADIAKKRALQDATILFNQTQQSSESPFLSTMQLDRSWMSVLFSIFRNSSMSYTRQTSDGARNLKRNLTPGQRAKSVEFMTKQILRDWGVDPNKATDAEHSKAKEAAEMRFRRQIKKDAIRIATFGYGLELLWNLGPYLPYLIFGNNDDEKDKMWDDAFTHSFFGSIEGLTGGDVMSAFGNMALSGEWSRYQLTKDMPLASDINTIIDKFIGGKNAEGFNDIINLVVQMGAGVNPQSITDAVIAITDACGDDPALSHEAAIFVMRVLQVPQSQLDKLYFDDVDLTGKEASKLSPAQLARRYAEYRLKRGAVLAPWSWGDEEQLGKYEKVAKDRMKERLGGQGDAKVIEAYEDFEARYKAVSKNAKEALGLMGVDRVAAAQAYAELQENPDFPLYRRFGDLDGQLNQLSKMWLAAKTPEEASLVASTISSYRAGMVKVLQAETVESQQSAMSELAALMNDFRAKRQDMQHK